MRRLAVFGLLALAACDPGSLYEGPVVGPDGGVTLCTPEVAPNAALGLELGGRRAVREALDRGVDRGLRSRTIARRRALDVR